MFESIIGKYYINKWNKNTYKVICVFDNEVTLLREDDTEFTISGREFRQNYRRKDVD